MQPSTVDKKEESCRWKTGKAGKRKSIDGAPTIDSLYWQERWQRKTQRKCARESAMICGRVSLAFPCLFCSSRARHSSPSAENYARVKQISRPEK